MASSTSLEKSQAASQSQPAPPIVEGAAAGWTSAQNDIWYPPWLSRDPNATIMERAKSLHGKIDLSETTNSQLINWTEIMIEASKKEIDKEIAISIKDGAENLISYLITNESDASLAFLQDYVGEGGSITKENGDSAYYADLATTLAEASRRLRPYKALFTTKLHPEFGDFDSLLRFQMCYSFIYFLTITYQASEQPEHLRSFSDRMMHDAHFRMSRAFTQIFMQPISRFHWCVREGAMHSMLATMDLKLIPAATAGLRTRDLIYFQTSGAGKTTIVRKIGYIVPSFMFIFGPIDGISSDIIPPPDLPLCRFIQSQSKEDRLELVACAIQASLFYMMTIFVCKCILHCQQSGEVAHSLTFWKDEEGKDVLSVKDGDNPQAIIDKYRSLAKSLFKKVEPNNKHYYVKALREIHNGCYHPDDDTICAWLQLLQADDQLATSDAHGRYRPEFMVKLIILADALIRRYIERKGAKKDRQDGNDVEQSEESTQEKPSKKMKLGDEYGQLTPDDINDIGLPDAVALFFGIIDGCADGKGVEALARGEEYSAEEKATFKPNPHQFMLSLDHAGKLFDLQSTESKSDYGGPQFWSHPFSFFEEFKNSNGMNRVWTMSVGSEPSLITMTQGRGMSSA